MDDQIKQWLAESHANEIGGNVALALQLAQQAFDRARVRGEPSEIAAALNRLSGAHFRLGHYPESHAFASQALTCAPANSIERADAFRYLGNWASATNDLTMAENNFLHAIDLYRRLNARKELFWCLHNLATHIYMPHGKFALALAADEESYHLGIDLNEPQDFGIVAVLVSLAYVSGIIGDRAKAHHWMDELARRVEPHSMPMGYHHAIAAELAMDADDFSGALDGLKHCRSIAEVTGEPNINLSYRLGSSRLHRLRGESAAALQWAEDALAYAERIGYQHYIGQAFIARAQANWVAGDTRAAETDLQSAVQVLTPVGSEYYAVYATFLLALLCQSEARLEAEQTWLGAAQRIQRGGYAFMLERERERAFPVIAAYLHSTNPDVRASAENLLPLLLRVPPRQLHIVGLGRFEVRQGHRQIPDRAWQRRKAGELFRFLLLQPHYSANRDVILESLWSHSSSSSQLLFNATSELRRTLEPELPDKFPSRYLEVETERVTLHLPPGSIVDFDQFDEAITRAISENDLSALTRASEGYIDDLFSLDRYADWATARREHLAQLYLRGMLTIAQIYLTHNQPRDALDTCQRILTREPWHEDAVLIGMRACLALNDRPGALRLYHDLKAALRKDLDISPRDDLQQLAASLK